jgi:AI-2 transport protein TqsA
MREILNFRNLSHFFFIAISSVFILWIGKNLFIPFVFALLVWFIIKQIRIVLNKVEFIKNKFPEWIKNVFSLLVVLSAINFIFNIVYANFRILANSINDYTKKFDIIIRTLDETLNIDLVTSLKMYIEDFDFNSFFLSLFNYSTGLMGTIFIVFVYTLFILLEESTFKTKLVKVFPDNEDFEDSFRVIKKIELSISKYLSLKTLISLFTSVLSYIALVIIGVDFPVFWAFLVFILNFIPIIGSYIATLTPFVFSLLQFGSFPPAFLVLFSIGSVQMVIGNFIDPRIMGNNVNLSPLVIILSLSFWGAIWGVIGMFLSVPLMIIVLIIFSKIPKFKPIAILMSRNGELD